MVGINVVGNVLGIGEKIFSCLDVYIGVFIDDLVIKGINELYWLLILCVEYWLLLCYDNVDLCFIDMGYELGLILEECYVRFNEKC